MGLLKEKSKYGSNSHWSQIMIEELERSGCKYFVISPGSRSTPLVLAAAANSKISKTVCIDERGAAFHAVGYTRATQSPAVLICTSGTALANYLPAVIEASIDNIPLIILSADRPPELHDTGANQTIFQRKIFDQYTIWDTEIPVPSERIDPRVLLTTIDQAVFRSIHSPGGPVHLNCHFAEPLEPEETPQVLIPSLSVERWQNNRSPFTSYSSNTDFSINDQNFIDSVTTASKGLIVAGYIANPKNLSIEKLGKHLGWPILSDFTSSVEGTPGLQLLLQSEKGRKLLNPTIILHFGSHIISKSYYSYIIDSNAELTQIINSPRRLDPTHMSKYRIVGEPEAIANQLIKLIPAKESTKQLDLITEAGGKVLSAATQHSENYKSINEPSVIRNTVKILAKKNVCGLFVANSMPIRDADTFCASLPPSLRIAANRGASGIDGNIASAIGFGKGLNKAVTLIIGDLAFIHDLSSLSQINSMNKGMIIVVINNKGGGVFSMLPIAKIASADTFDRYFNTPQTVDLKSIASSFKIDYFSANSIEQFIVNFNSATDIAIHGKCSLVEVTINKEQNVALHQNLFKLIDDEL